MVNKFVFIVILLAGILTGCNLTSSIAAPTVISTIAPTLGFVEPTPLQPISPAQLIIIMTATPHTAQQAVLDRAADVIHLIKNQDMTTLAGYVHPQLGLRFSPYAFVRDTDNEIPPDGIAGLLTDPTVHPWGAYSGSGEPIDLTFVDYYSQFVYDLDFANAPEISLNHRLGVSTSMDNIFAFYRSSMFVEYYFPGFDPQFEGMDWRSLRLVFMQDNDTWYLVGIIHDQWTT